MPKLPRLTADDAEAMLMKASFVCGRGVVVPFHSGATLHPKIIKQVHQAIEEASLEPIPPE